ncbi:MAG: hypothetical protein IBX62_04510 [Coriobacteriia bacterium]|nr:hypothetical protein [Coriobacteriia bacterium]
MTRRRRRKIILITLLALLLAFVALWYVNFRETKSLKFDFIQTTRDAVDPPTYLFSFGGEGEPKLKRPVGVLAVGDTVYVADAKQGLIFRFGPKGEPRGTFGEDRLRAPLYLADHPESGELYITDRGTRSVVVFGQDGEFKREFKPNLPEEQRPPFETHGVEWLPVALGFAPDGTLYVSEILNGHRLLMFGPDGEFKKAVGIAGIAKNPLESPYFFQFPNNIKVRGDEVWVVDSNNRRVQIFDPSLGYSRTISTSGLPRGLTFVTRSSEATTAERAVLVDTLSHDAGIWNLKGELLVNFGQQGIAEGLFNYPGDVTVGLQNVLYISDTVNERVQAWGWPAEISPVPTVKVPQYWYWCLAPLLLLPLLLLLRKKRYVATADFVEALFEKGEAEAMVVRRVKWLASPEDYEKVKHLRHGEIAAGDLLEEAEHSESDARALEEKLGITYRAALVASIAQRSKLLGTEDAELQRVARLLEVDAVDHAEYLERRKAKERSA